MNIEQKKNIIRAAFKTLLRDDFETDFDDIPLFEIGIDSLDFFEKMVYLEEDLGMSFTLEDITNKVTINDLVFMLKDSK